MTISIVVLNTLALIITAYVFLTRLSVMETMHIFEYGFKFRPIQIGFKKNKLAKSFYRIYKYMYIQSKSGARPEEILKSLHRVLPDKKIKVIFLQMSVLISQSNDLKKGISHIKESFRNEEGILMAGILESILTNGLSSEAYFRLDQMLFQKYLTQLKEETTKTRRLYFYAVVCFVFAASGVLFLPLIDQMMKSTNLIFN